MEHKNLIIVLALFAVGLFVIFSLNKPAEEETPTTTLPLPPSSMPLPPSSGAPPIDVASPIPTAPEGAIPEGIPLSDLQISACREADAGGTCQTKLKDLGLVSLEDCCTYLKKCC